MFVDTNIIIFYITGILDPELKKQIDKYIIAKKAYISSIVYGEVIAYSGYDEEQVKEVKEFLTKNFNIKNIDLKIVDLAAKIARIKKLETGKKLKLTDALISATAIKYKLALLTKDEKDFKNIDGLMLAEY